MVPTREIRTHHHQPHSFRYQEVFRWRVRENQRPIQDVQRHQTRGELTKITNNVQGRRTKSQAHARDAYKGAPKAQTAPAYKAQNEQSAHNSKQGGARYIRTNKGYKNTPWPLKSFNFNKLTLFENRLKNGTFLPSWRRKVHKRSPARKKIKKNE